jgi:hypothetical protein
VTALVDTGSALTIVSEEFCRVFGLPICSYNASFITADGRQSGKIIGKVDFTLQVHRELALNLSDVSVQPGTEVGCILGCDVLNGDVNALTHTVVHCGHHIDWKLRSRGGVTLSTAFTARPMAVSAATPDSPTSPAAPRKDAWKAPGTGSAPNYPPPPAKVDQGLRNFAQATPGCIVSLTTTALTPAAKKELQQLADHRQQQLTNRVLLQQPVYAAQMEETSQRLFGLGIQRPLAEGLLRCLRCGTNRHTPSVHYRLAKVIQGFEQTGEEGVR